MFAFAGSALTRQNMNENQIFGFEFGTVGARLGKKVGKRADPLWGLSCVPLSAYNAVQLCKQFSLFGFKKVCNFND